MRATKLVPNSISFEVIDGRGATRSFANGPDVVVFGDADETDQRVVGELIFVGYLTGRANRLGAPTNYHLLGRAIWATSPTLRRIYTCPADPRPLLQRRPAHFVAVGGDVHPTFHNWRSGRLAPLPEPKLRLG